MKKIIGTRTEEVSKYLLDTYSILHFICGIFGYIIVYFILRTFFVNMLSEFESLFVTYITIILGGIIWEMAENSFLIDMKVFKERDYIINSQMDVILVFLGGILGCYLYDLSLLLTIFIIVGLFIFYVITKFLTEKNNTK